MHSPRVLTDDTGVSAARNLHLQMRNSQLLGIQQMIPASGEFLRKAWGKSRTMSAYIIHIGLDLKEAFNYRRSLNADSVHALGEYAKATYGEHAVLRHMTPDEESEFARTGDLSNHPRWSGKSSSRMADVSGRRSQEEGAKV